MKSPCRPAALMSSAAAMLSAVCLCFALCALYDTPCTAGVTFRVSVSSYGTEGSGSSEKPSISADGRYVSFESDAANLVTGDTNEDMDVFVYDCETGVTERVSLASDGTQPHFASGGPSLSMDGMLVVFCSDAPNLVADDSNNRSDVFVYNRHTGITERVSVSSEGRQALGPSGQGCVSADGRFVAFTSSAPNLVPNDTNNHMDVFLRDRETGVTTRVSVSSDGVESNGASLSPAISADGRYVSFESCGQNLVPGDTNGYCDIFVHDRLTGVTERVSISSGGTQGDYQSVQPCISADGRFVAFQSFATDLVPGDTNGDFDVFVHDRFTSTTERVSVTSNGVQADDCCECPSISADGRYVVFQSDAANLAPRRTCWAMHIYVHDRQTGDTQPISLGKSIESTDVWSRDASISADGRYITFSSRHPGLVPGDTNCTWDIFVHDRWGIGNTKALPDASPAVISAGTVTADLSGCFYVQDADRSSGIKVSWPGEVVAGDRYRIDGFVDTDVNGERYINAWNVRRVDALPIAPLGVRGSLIGGSSLGYDPTTKAGQQGITGAAGLNNIGLLIKTWGKVTQIGDNYLYVDDGSSLRDGTFTGSVQNIGIRVICDPSEYEPGDNLTVTGISSCFRTGNSLARQILIRSADDIEKK